MLFYSIEARFDRVLGDEEYNERKKKAASICVVTGDYIEKHDNKAGFFVVSSGRENVSLAVAVHYHCAKNIKIENELAEFLRLCDISARMTRCEEITIRTFRGNLRLSERNDYIGDDKKVLEKFGIGNITEDITFYEKITEDNVTKQQQLALCRKLLCEESLATELERIYTGGKYKELVGHPVHYLIRTDDLEIKINVIRSLVLALYNNGRVGSRRYCGVRYDCSDRVDRQELEELYTACEGATVVLEYMGEDFHESTHLRGGTAVLNTYADIMRKYKNRVQTIFYLKRNAEKAADILLENVGYTVIVPLSEDTVSNEKARQYLKAKAEENGIEGDKKLYTPIRPDKAYSSADLNVIYDRWLSEKLTHTVYPQYSYLDVKVKASGSKKSKRSALEELNEMIGLKEAKKVISEALDFYKARRLFRSRGMTVGDRCAMHMVFTGNPGTAKTRVARLFAHIMKENSLLPVGDLHEVGRADLVGKYVGWTAQIVRDKFKEARGSVLFIDEAYSLVDDKDGLYGDEAISTIVQEMENYRDELVVIFAGYPDKMELFLQKNPGLRSRITFPCPV